MNPNNAATDTLPPVTTGEASSLTPILNSYDDPLFISNSENIGVPLVTQRLTRPQNFITWKISMEMALQEK